MEATAQKCSEQLAKLQEKATHTTTRPFRQELWNNRSACSIFFACAHDAPLSKYCWLSGILVHRVVVFSVPRTMNGSSDTAAGHTTKLPFLSTSKTNKLTSLNRWMVCQAEDDGYQEGMRLPGSADPRTNSEGKGSSCVRDDKPRDHRDDPRNCNSRFAVCWNIGHWCGDRVCENTKNTDTPDHRKKRQDGHAKLSSPTSPSRLRMDRIQPSTTLQLQARYKASPWTPSVVCHFGR